MTLKLKKITKNKRLLILMLLIVAAAVVGIVFAIHGSKKTPSTIPSTTPSPNTSGTNSSPSSATGNTKSQGSTSTSNQTSTNAGPGPLAPWGTFISNHHPGQNGSPTIEQSTCNTTPGAVCYIKFTSGDIAKALSTETANSDGTVIWDWDVSQAGLTSGNWQVTAVATLNNQTKSTTDPMALVIQ